MYLDESKAITTLNQIQRRNDCWQHLFKQCLTTDGAIHQLTHLNVD